MDYLTQVIENSDQRQSLLTVLQKIVNGVEDNSVIRLTDSEGSRQFVDAVLPVLRIDDCAIAAAFGSINTLGTVATNSKYRIMAGVLYSSAEDISLSSSQEKFPIFIMESEGDNDALKFTAFTFTNTINNETIAESLRTALATASTS